MADKMLLNAIALNATVTAERQKAETELLALAAAVDAQDDLADRLVAQISDDVWNKIGRPAFDPTYDVVFPNGISYYTGGPDTDQPERMELLAQLLEMNIITRLPEADARAMAARVLDGVPAGAGAHRCASRPGAHVREGRHRAGPLGPDRPGPPQAAVPREGFSEAEIHTVIPDHPRKKVTAAKPTAPAPA